MRRILLLPILLILLFSIPSQAQHYKDLSTDAGNLGIGFGFDYGGIGGNFTVYPQKNIGLFLGAGYALAGFGYNAGIKLRLLPGNGNSQFTPFFMAMYGYNAAVAVSNASQYNKLFYGPTVGVGCDLGSHEVGKGVFSLAIFVPIRNSDAQNYIDNLKNNYGISFKNNLLPIGFSVGYKFNIF